MANYFVHIAVKGETTTFRINQTIIGEVKPSFNMDGYEYTTFCDLSGQGKTYSEAEQKAKRDITRGLASLGVTPQFVVD